MKRIKYVMLSTVLTAFLLVMLILTTGSARTSSLRIGLAEVEITPPTGFSMAGYGLRKGVSDGVLDPLYARILVMEGTTEKVALVTMDLIGTFSQPRMDFIREEVKTSNGINQVFFLPSHTHSGPSFGRRSADSKVEEWVESIVHSIIGTIVQADGNLTESLVGFGYGQAAIAQNRRLVRPDGTVKMITDGPINFPTYPVDQTVGIVRFDDTRGKPIAILVNYACHPVVFYYDNMKYSADFPGAMAGWVKEHFPGNPMCFFVQGACGNINPVTNPVPIALNGLKIKNELGRILGKEVVRAGLEIRPHAVPEARLRSLIKEIPFKNRWDAEKMIERAKKRYGEEAVSWLKSRLSKDIKAPLSVIVLENEFGICGFPGEFFVEFQVELRNRFTELPLFFAGYTNGSLGYFPTIRAAVEGGYGADNFAVLTEVGAGEHMMDIAVVVLNELTGKLTREQQR